MQSEKPGIQAAGGVGEPPKAEDEQLPLLGGADPGQDVQLPIDPPAGPGRPPGSRNKRTAEWTEYLLGHFTSPLEGLAEVSVMTIEECKTLAGELGCKPLDIWERQQWAHKELAPYLRQKRPIAIDAGKDGLVVLQLAVPGRLAHALDQVYSGEEIKMLDVPSKVI